MASVIHVALPGSLLRQSGERLLVQRDGTTVLDRPFRQIAAICCYGLGVSVTTPLIQALSERGIPLAWLTRTGRLRARCVPPAAGDSLRRIAQYERCRDPQVALAHARAMAHAKLDSQAAVLRRRHRGVGRPLAGLGRAMRRLHRDIATAPSAGVLRAIEGRIGRLYFRAQSALLAEPLRFPRRSRPAADLANAGLNLLYTCLTLRLDSQIQVVGLDPGVAPLHAPVHGRPALACDLVETLRAPLVDAFWFPALGRRIFGPADIVRDGPHGTRFTQEALARLLTQWEEFLLDPQVAGPRRIDDVVRDFLHWCLGRSSDPEANGLDPGAVDDPSSTDMDDPDAA